MGIFNRGQGGFRCDPMDETGESMHCQVFEGDRKEGKIATGTDFVVRVSRENNCEPEFVGAVDILEKDQAKVSRIIEQKVKACRKGLG